MPDEKSKYEALPIPTYEEAIGSSSRTSDTTEREETTYPEERDGLLGAPGGRIPVPTRRVGYRPPPTEDNVSTRDGDDGEEEHDRFLGQEHGGRNSRDSGIGSEDEEVRREMEEMEILDPLTTPSFSSRRGRSAWGKRLSHTLSSLPFSFKWQWQWRWKPTLPSLHWPVIDSSFCIILARCFAILLVMAVVYLLFVSDIFTSAAQRMGGQMFDPESVRIHVQSMVDESKIAQYLRIITSSDHLAGTEGDYALAEYVEKFFKSNYLEDVKMEEFGVYLNYPKEGGRRVEILDNEGGVAWAAGIEESMVYGGARNQTPVFHGHSKSGDVTGPLIYVNYGSREDYKTLYDSGIAVEGAIALVRYYGSQGDRALKIKAAEAWGFKGVIIYSDPADDGFLKGEVAPNGRYMPEDGVQRGAVSLMSWVVGDVLTPGWASIKGANRIPKEDSKGLVNIPSVPLSWGDAQHLLQAIQGFGQAVLNDEGKGGVPNVEYWSGNLSSPQVHLVNDQDEVEQQPIWNVMGKITGYEQKEKSIIVGNHRDAWVYGASDPGSGTAVMLEVIRIFGDLVQRGWRPLRTIEFASWDGEEYNLIGSTEHVELNMDKLRLDAYAYLNVDVAVAGQEFKAAGSPVFRKSLLRVLDRTTDPNQNATLRELWDKRGGKLDGLGAGSDYVAFQDMAGTSSLDFGFDGPPYPYHSAYDNFEWMATVGDPGFTYHKLLAQIWALLILEFSDRLVLPFDMSSYSSSLTRWVMDLENWSENKGTNQDGSPWNTEPLREAVLQFARETRLFEEWEQGWDAQVLAGGGFESRSTGERRKSHNNRMANFETHLLDLEEGGGVCLISFPTSPFPPPPSLNPYPLSPSLYYQY
jgi:hypothetical protein